MDQGPWNMTTKLLLTICPSFVLILKEAQVNACGMKHVQCHINTHSAFFNDSNSQSLFQSAS